MHLREHSSGRTCKNPDALAQSFEVHLRGTYYADRRRDPSPTASKADAVHRFTDRPPQHHSQNATMCILRQIENQETVD